LLTAQGTQLHNNTVQVIVIPGLVTQQYATKKTTQTHPFHTHTNAHNYTYKMDTKKINYCPNHLLYRVHQKINSINAQTTPVPQGEKNYTQVQILGVTLNSSWNQQTSYAHKVIQKKLSENELTDTIPV